jgi:hypothetical protein
MTAAVTCQCGGAGAGAPPPNETAPHRPRRLSVQRTYISTVVFMSGWTAFVALLREMLRKQGARTLALAGWAVWACALPTNNAPPTAGSAGAGGGGGSGNTAAGMNGGTSTGGSAAGMTGGTTTGGTTGGTMTGGTTTGGTAGSTGGTTTGGTTTGGTAGSTGGTTTGGTAGSMAGAGMGGSMAGAGAGQGGTAGSVAGAGSGGKGGTAGTGGTPGVLKHRYSFSGSDTTAVDSVGNTNGTLMNGATQSGGVVNLAGGTTDQYVNLQSGVLVGLSAATLEAWTSWTGGTSNWQRVFDFGLSDQAAANGEQGNTNTTSPYLFFTPRAQATTNPNCTNATASRPRVALTSSGPANEYCAFGGAAFPTGLTHVAVTIDATSMALYINGSPEGSPVTLGTTLSVASGSFAWLGRSLFFSDTEYAGTISEFRIYPTARSASQISASASAGPDSVPSQ